MKERDLQKAILDYLKLKRYVAVKFSSVGVFNPRSGGYIPQRQRGVSDILACSPQGRFIAIEVKIKPRQPTPEQRIFLEEIKLNNGVSILAYSIDDVIKELTP